MAKNPKSAQANETLDNAQNNLPTTNEQNNLDIFAGIDALENAQEGELIELTSEILKLEAGESFTGVMTNKTEMVDSQDAGGQPFEAVVMYAKNKSKVLIADVVALSAQKKLFAGIDASTTAYKAVKIVNHGMRKSTAGGGKEYRDLKIYTA